MKHRVVKYHQLLQAAYELRRTVKAMPSSDPLEGLFSVVVDFDELLERAAELCYVLEGGSHEPWA